VQKLFQAGSFLEGIAKRSWEIEPSTTSISQEAFFLPGQFERVTRKVYTDDPRRDMAGGIVTVQPPTRSFEVNDAMLVDGSLYRPGKRLDLHSRIHLPELDGYIPRMQVEYEIDCGAIYNTYEGNEYVGLWLTDDCQNYLLAKEYGVIVGSNRNITTHIPQYEERLGMTTLRVNSAFLRKTMLFDDNWGNNASKLERFEMVRKKLLAGVKAEPGGFSVDPVVVERTLDLLPRLSRTSQLGPSRISLNPEQIGLRPPTGPQGEVQESPPLLVQG